MLAVKAVSNYSALAEDQINVKEGQLFYVLSMTSDGRKYYLSTSSRVPFSRVARSGYAPVPLFVVVGDTLPPAVRAKVKMMVSDYNASQPAARLQKSEGEGRNATMMLPESVACESTASDCSAPVTEQEQRKGISQNISAVARYWFGGFLARSSRDGNRSSPLESTVSLDTRSGSDHQVGDSSQQMSVVQTPQGLPLGASPSCHVVGAQIVTYTRREIGVVYRIKFSLTDGAEMFVRSTYDDIKSLDCKIRQRYAELPALPAPVPASEEEATAAARGKALNLYLQGVVRVHRQLIAKSGQGLGLEAVCGGPDHHLSPTGQHQLAPSVVSKYLQFGFGFPGAKRRRSSGDSGFASRPASRKNSIQNEAPLPAMAEDSQHHGGVDAGYKQVVVQPAGAKAVSEVAANGGLAKMTRRLERLASFDRSAARP